METARLTARSYELTFAIEQIEAIELEGLMETGGEVEEVEE
jgi:hypothetical protein